MQRAILGGSVLCGGACFYSYSAAFALNEIVEHDQFIQAPKAMRIKLSNLIVMLFTRFTSRLLAIDADHELDLGTGHLFGSAKCECGSYERCESIKLIRMDIMFGLESNIREHFRRQHKKPSPQKLLDCLHSKQNAIKLARDILNAILQVGVFIHDDDNIR